MREGEERRAGSGSSADVLGFSETAFTLLRELIAQRTGVYFADSKRDLLADKLSDALATLGMSSYLDYYYLLRYDADAERHWADLVNRLAVPETYFWRQPDQIIAVAKALAPRHFARRPTSTFRIWSAACCTGEEPLSIAIALAEAGLLGTRPIEIVASDASGAMIERARRGVYGERSFRALPDAMRERWFRSEGAGWRIDPRLHDAIQWRTANLVDAADVAELGRADLVFCRNVLIYFSDATVAHVARLLASAMPDDGHLCLGASESLTRTSSEFELVEIAGAFMYRKGVRSAAAADGTSHGATGYLSR